MKDNPEFPQASPEMKYIIQQIHAMQELITCSTSYHKDHKELRARLDKIDQSYAQINQLFVQMDFSHLVNFIDELKLIHTAHAESASELAEKMFGEYIKTLRKLESDNKTLLAELKQNYSYKYNHLDNQMKEQYNKSYELYNQNLDLIEKNKEKFEQTIKEFKEKNAQIYQQNKELIDKNKSVFDDLEKVRDERINAHVDKIASRFVNDMYVKISEKIADRDYRYYLVCGAVGLVIGVLIPWSII